ncbi:MAG: imidazole glycerol phosphate synthase subunit HisH [Rickettsiales bacterium]
MNTASVIIIDYGSGNLRSVAKAFERTGANVKVSSDVASLESSSHIVLPGVGAFGDCMEGLSAIPGMLSALNEQVRVRGKWFLGICVGMQMLFDNGYEHGIHKGLGWISGDVVAINAGSLKIPQMGWNNLQIKQKSVLLKNIDDGEHAYFVHSYHAKLKDSSGLLAVTEYGEEITAVVGKDNIFGTQFHPEKSQKTGLKIIENFVSL